MRISIITPSFNQDKFILETLKTIHLNKSGDLEHIVIDGGSTDKTCEIIRQFEGELSYWSSEPDDGQYDALNKGFARSTGEIMGWLNSDDVYYPWTIRTVLDIFQQFPKIE